MLTGGFAPAAAVELQLRAQVAPQTSVVRVRDVAEVLSADRELGRRLAGLPLMPSPAPETQRFLHQREISDMLAASGIDLAEIRFSGPTHVVVTAKSVVAPVAHNEPITNNVNAFQDKRNAILTGGPAAAVAVQLDETQTEALKALVSRIVGDYVKRTSGAASIGRLECTVSERQLSQLALATSAPVCSGGTAPWTGRQSFVFAFATPQGPAKIQVAAEIAELPIAAIVATRPVARGNVVTAADVELRMVEPSAKTSGARAVLDSVEGIIGREARQAIQAGEIVFADQVRSPLMVKRGDVISVGSQGGGIRVSTSARALQDGAHGDLIQVEAIGSKDHFDVRVVGLRQAAIFAVTRPQRPQQAEPPRTARTGQFNN